MAPGGTAGADLWKRRSAIGSRMSLNFSSCFMTERRIDYVFYWAVGGFIDSFNMYIGYCH